MVLSSTRIVRLLNRYKLFFLLYLTNCKIACTLAPRILFNLQFFLDKIWRNQIILVYLLYASPCEIWYCQLFLQNLHPFLVPLPLCSPFFCGLSNFKISFHMFRPTYPTLGDPPTHPSHSWGLNLYFLSHFWLQSPLSSRLLSSSLFVVVFGRPSWYSPGPCWASPICVWVHLTSLGSNYSPKWFWGFMLGMIPYVVLMRDWRKKKSIFVRKKKAKSKRKKSWRERSSFLIWR